MTMPYRSTLICIMSNLSALLLLTVLAPFANAAGPVLQSQGPCTVDQFGDCLTFFGFTPAFSARTLNFNALSAGSALVSVNGSGYCESQDVDSVEVAEFDTQIVNKPSAVAVYSKPGGNKFKFTLPADATPLSGNGVFNLSAQRLFPVSAAGVQHYALNIAVSRLDTDTLCAVNSLALTVLFIPQ